MGYSTNFDGHFDLDRQMTLELATAILAFHDTRHQANGPGSAPDEGCPGIWCKWVPTDDNKGIEWDQGEKFYDYIAWLQLIIDRFLKPNDHVLNGRVRWRGEEFADLGTLIVEDNIITIKNGSF